MKDGEEVPVRCSSCGRLVGFSFSVDGKPACEGFIECFDCVRERDRKRVQESVQSRGV